MTHINRLFLEALIGQLKTDNILGVHETLIRDVYKEISVVLDRTMEKTKFEQMLDKTLEQLMREQS